MGVVSYQYVKSRQLIDNIRNYLFKIKGKFKIYAGVVISVHVRCAGGGNSPSNFDFISQRLHPPLIFNILFDFGTERTTHPQKNDVSNINILK